MCRYCICLFVVAVCSGAYAADAASSALDSHEHPVLHYGGCGGVYFLAEPGDFWVEIEKYDLNKSNRKTFLRAILAGPDRAVVGEATLPHAGLAAGKGPGPLQQARLTATVSRKGVYALNVTVSEDRYGEHIAWGFRTNCPHYLIETSRGHRDAPHEEPLVLLSPDACGEICFLPEHDSFSIDVSGYASSEPPIVYNGAGQRIAILQPDDKGNGRCTVPADVPRDSIPWRLHLPTFQATVHIDGVTRWSDASDYPNLSLWTPHAASWFPFHENRWILTPYSRKRYLESGAGGNVQFEIHNNGFTTRVFNVELEFPDQSWDADLSAGEVTVKARETAAVLLEHTMPDSGETFQCHLRITPQDTPEFSTYSTFTLRRGAPPAAEPLDLPLAHTPYNHENERLGYLPQYPTSNQVYFAASGRPFIVSDAGLSCWRENKWATTSEVILANGEIRSFRTRSSKIAFDASDNVYLIGEVDKQPVLLYSHDQGEHFSSCDIPGHGALDIEQFSGHNIPGGPPPVARYTLTEKDPNLMWRRLNDLDLFLPETDETGALSMGKPIAVTRKCIGFSAHSGIPSSIVSRDDKVHVAWAEATEPDEEAPGVPTYVVTYDRRAQRLGQAALVGYGPPANDVHNTPSITMDSRGYLHVLVGTHGRTFQYARSLEPNDAGGGWTEPEELGAGLRQTYVGFVCDKNDALHVVFRLWFNDRTYFPAGNYATLAYMRKPSGKPWSAPRVLVVSPFSEYGVFYHRLTLDHNGRLFLSYDCWSTYWFYRTDHRGDRRALMMSPDGGAAWRLANMVDLLK